MKVKKIRGHKRIWADIEKWRSSNLIFDIENLKSRERDYAKIWIHPFSGYSMLNSQFPEPKGETRKRILSGLLDIYASWKNQLDELNEPYYLKIWLYEPYLTNSQVVCAIGEFLNFYDTTFFSPEIVGKALDPENYGALKEKMKAFNWEYRYDEEHLDNATIGSPDEYDSKEEYLKEKKWFSNKLKKTHRIIKYKELSGDASEGYSFKKGIVWIGEKQLK